MQVLAEMGQSKAVAFDQIDKVCHHALYAAESIFPLLEAARTGA